MTSPYTSTPDPEADALEEEITRGSLRDHRWEATNAAGASAGVGPEGAPPLRTGTLVWGVIALLVALWSLAVTVLDWTVDPVLVMIVLAGVGGVALLVGGIAGAARHRT